MNALLQALTGCKIFMDYINKLFLNMKFTLLDEDNILGFYMIGLLKQLSLGSNETNPTHLYKYLCNKFT